MLIQQDPAFTDHNAEEKRSDFFIASFSCFKEKKKFISFECICIYSRYLFGSNIIMVKYWGDKDIIFGVLILIKTSISGMSMKNNKSPAFLCTNNFFYQIK